MTRPRPRRADRRLRRRNNLVEANLTLVRPIAAHYAASSAECREDLQQVGLMGLIRAAELYDLSLAVPFSAYARRHIRGAILHYLRDTAPLVRPPRRVQERRQALLKLETTLRQQLGRPPVAEELRQALGLTSLQWRHTQEDSPWPERLWLQQDLLEQLPCPEKESESCGTGVLAGLQSLELRQRRVIQAVVLQGESLRAVAQREHSSAATVHRLLHRGLAELRIRLSRPSDAQAC
ncbi:MAG: hypothetical protein RLZZ611_128 [Cyanobacteriota bacterium]|jgi:RNA polymerase sigma-B factor